MPRIPAAALAHLPQQVAENIADVGRPLNVIESTPADETLVATRDADLFVFDARTMEGNDTIVGYDPRFDRVQILQAASFDWVSGPDGTDIQFTGFDANWNKTSGSVQLANSYDELNPYDTITIHSFWPGVPDPWGMI